MKRKYQGTLKIRSCYPGWINDLMGSLIIPIAQFDKFEMKRSMLENDICFFHIEQYPAGVYLRIEEVLYEEKI